MKILKSKRNANTVSLEIETDLASLEKHTELAFKQMVKHANIPGFRKGKINRSMFEKSYGKDTLIQEAIQDVINEAYSQAIKELDLKVVDMAQNLEVNDYKEGVPTVFRCDVTVQPIVKLGKYKGFKIKKDSEVVTEETVTLFLNDSIRRDAKYAPVERASQKDDLVRLQLNTFLDGAEYAIWTNPNTAVKIGMGLLGTEFDEKLTGVMAGDKKEFSIKYPSDFPNKEVANKNLDFKVEIIEVQEEQLPELTEEYLKKNFGYTTPDELKEKIRTYLEEEQKRKVDEKLKNDLITAVVDDIKVDLPEAMIEREINYNLNLFNENLKKSNTDLENYLKVTQKHIDDLKSEMRPSAEKNVKASLALEAIAEKEKIEITDSELEEEIKKWNIPNISTIEDLTKAYKDYDLDNLKGSLKTQKTFKFLTNEAKITNA